LDWAAHNTQLGRFLLLMTPHSVRRPDGFCLRELARALERGIPVIPVMLTTCEPPLSLAHLQWLDLRVSVPELQLAISAGESPEPDTGLDRYLSDLEQLCRALRAGMVPFDALHARLIHWLSPDAFEADLRRHLARFVGRVWVADRVGAWTSDAAGEPLLWLTAKPGFGKTTVAAHLYASRPEIAAAYFCVHDSSRKSDPRRVVMTVAYQLSRRLPEYENRLSQLQLEELTTDADAGALFDALIVQPLSGLQVGAPVVILIDGLDEISRNGENALASTLGARLSDLPSWLRVLVLSRPEEPELQFALQSYLPVRIDTDPESNRRDLYEYVSRSLTTDDATSSLLVKRSEGLFLYVVLAVDALRQLGRPVTFDDVGAVPKGLHGMFGHYFRRQFPDRAVFKANQRPVLEVLVARREPPSRDWLMQFFGWSDYEAEEILAAFGSLLSLVDGRLRLFHLAAVEWLTDRTRAGAYFASREAGDRRLAEYSQREYEQAARPMDPYALRNLPEHLASIGNWTALAAVLLDPRYLTQRVDALGYGSLDVLERWSRECRDALTHGPEIELLREVSFAARRLRGFRGRKAETTAVEKWLRAESVSGIVIGGPPGIGKTFFLLNLRFRDIGRRLMISESGFVGAPAAEVQLEVHPLIEALTHGLNEWHRSLYDAQERRVYQAVERLRFRGISTVLVDFDRIEGNVSAARATLTMLSRLGIRCVVTARSWQDIQWMPVDQLQMLELQPLTLEETIDIARESLELLGIGDKAALLAKQAVESAGGSLTQVLRLLETLQRLSKRTE
jgi:hypothetical protein